MHCLVFTNPGAIERDTDADLLRGKRRTVGSQQAAVQGICVRTSGHCAGVVHANAQSQAYTLQVSEQRRIPEPILGENSNGEWLI